MWETTHTAEAGRTPSQGARGGVYLFAERADGTQRELGEVKEGSRTAPRLVV